MELNFKDTKSKKLFNEVEKLDLKQPSIKEDDIFNINEVIPLSKKQDTPQIKKSIPDKIDEKNNDITHEVSLQYLQRIESKQNAIMEILESVPLPTVKQIDLNATSKNDIDDLKLNLRIFNDKLMILSTQSDNKNIELILVTLQNISEYLMSNSFHIFSKDNSPVNILLKELDYLGMGDSTLNQLIENTIKILMEIDTYAKQDIFEQSYNFSNLLLEKGLVLNAVTLFNESAGMYIIQSAKSQSKEINKYISLTSDNQISKLYSQSKDFFINIFLDPKENPNTVPLFSHHKIVKDMDNEIERKFKNIQTTLRKKGDGAVFERYAYLTKRLRIIRNTLAHGNLEINFRSLVTEITELNDDFYHLAIKKNILKR